MTNMRERARLYLFERRRDATTVGFVLAAALLGGYTPKRLVDVAYCAAVIALWWFRPWRRR